MASDESYERLMKKFDNLQRLIALLMIHGMVLTKWNAITRNGNNAASLSETKSYATF